ncbi:methylated-DNA--[protein]-cysteine S-methyltransferase [soil metagenome]|nr:methylated-DNA--[protein]-cysteine S-methyltransferase [Actinomycetota bacterium]MDQ3216592.1 methylated-DNA--[protein]-cysteine S-methyltransferase [Actinomycetota bacterium]
MANLGYQTRTTDVGRLLLAAGDDGLCLLAFDSDFGVQESLDRLERSGADLAEGGAAVDQAAQEVDAYLGGLLRKFTVPVDLSLARPFARRVLRRLMSVGFGELTSYGELARAEGTAPRAVGGAVGSNPVAIVVPCHRVVAADGSLGGYSSGLDLKRALLQIEGNGGLSGGWGPRRRRSL